MGNNEEIIPDGNEPSFSLHEFRQWMDCQSGGPPPMSRTNRFEPIIGTHVMPRFSNAKKLANKISVEEGDLQHLVKDFRRSGGKIVSIDQECLVVEVESGRFAIPGVLVISDF